MDPATAKIVNSATATVAEMDATFGPFRAEMQTMLLQLQTSMNNQGALQEKSKALGVELEAARLSHQESKSEEEELASALRQVQEDITRLTDEGHKARLANVASENLLRETKARVAALESTRELGAGWTGDQLEQQALLRQQRDEAVAALDAKRRHVETLRGDVGLLSAQISAAQAQKAEADGIIAKHKDAIGECKNSTLAAARSRELAERELKEAQEATERVRQELAEKTREAEQGAAELRVAQEGLRDDKARLDRSVKDYDTLRGRGGKLSEDVENQVKINASLAAELHTLNENAAVARQEAARLKKEAERFGKLHDLTMKKIMEAETRQGDAEARQSELRRRADEVENELALERRKNELKRQAVDDARREKDVLARTLAGAADKSKAAADAVALQKAIARNLQNEVGTADASLKELRGEIAKLLEERGRYAAQAEEAQQAYFTALEGMKLQELQMAALQRKIEEGQAKVKQQQSLYDSVRADRNTYSKSLAEATAEINEKKHEYRQLGHAIESLKVDIEGKDRGLVRVHAEHHRTEKEKESLRNELTRIQKQVQSCDQIIGSQDAEKAKLEAIVLEADREKGSQLKEYESVVAEKNLLQAQLIKREAELSTLYERLRVQKSMLANGAVSFARCAAEREDAASRLAALKGEVLVAKTQTGDVAALEGEAKRLEADVRAEKSKIRVLTEELERPLNIHRWRTLADRDPERWALIQRAQALQKRLLDTRDELQAREAAIGEREREYAQVKAGLARQPGPELAEAVAGYQATLKGKAKQLAALEAELAAYRSRADEYRREVARLQEATERLAEDYVRRMRAARRAAAARASAGGAGAGVGGSSSSSALDDAALLDVTLELAAAGLTASRGGSRGGAFGGGAWGAAAGAAAAAGAGAGGGGGGDGALPAAARRTSQHVLVPEAVLAVKDEADAMLAAYADVLGSVSASSSSQ